MKWTRKSLKQRGKAAMMMNYWKTVLVSLILGLLLSGAFTVGFNGGRGDYYTNTTDSVSVVTEDLNQAANSTTINLPGDINGSMDALANIITPAVGLAIVGVVLLIVLVTIIVILLINAFLFNPLEVGGRRFFLQNLHTKAEVKEVAFGYDHCYKNNVKTLFLRDLYTILWSLLFIIPGIVKFYQYRMMPYILSEHPDMPTDEVFARSKELMHGQKWRTFVLDLSFLGWEILSILTLGLLHIFFVGPYRNMTFAALYEALEYSGREADSTVWTES